MGIVLFLLYLVLCIGAYAVFLMLFKNRYTTYYQTDDIIDTNDETYAVYTPENRWKDYIKEYTVYINDEYRFLKIELTEKVEYINVNILCYRNKKIKRIISFLNEIDVKQDNYVIKLPDNCDEIKLNVVEVNGGSYFEDSNIKRDVLWQSIVSSILLGISASVLLFVFRLGTIGFENEFFNRNHLYQVLYYEPWVYVAGAIFIVLLSASLFLVLFISNSVKRKKAKFNKVKKLNINKVLKTKFKIIKHKNYESYFVKLKPKRKRKFKKGEAIVSCFDENGKKLGEKSVLFTKKRRKIWITNFKGIRSIKVDFSGADFKKIYYKNGTFRRKITKKGVSCNFLRLDGIKRTRTIFIISILLLSSFSIYKYYEFSSVNSDLSNFKFEYTDNSKSQMTITEYTGKNRIVVIPKEFNDCPIVSVSEGAFTYNLHISEVYFTAPIEIKPAAFQNCLNIKKVDFSYVTRIGSHAFGGSRIRELIVDHQMVIENGAFANNQFFRKVVIYDTASTIMSGAFENTKTRYLEVHQGSNRLDSGFYGNGEVDSGYIFDTYPINHSNYTNYVNSNKIKVQNDCVHDNTSFFLRNGRIVDTKSYRVDAVITPATCKTYGINSVICNYCGGTYQVYSELDPNGHIYGDNGHCIYCGKRDPSYVPPEDVEEGDQNGIN